jgi:tetratricopeptide (TPR) repeat protein
MYLAAALLTFVQVGPNPSFERPPIEPEELTELRRRRESATVDASDSPSRLEECLALSQESPLRGADFARRWKEVARREEAAEASHCLGFVHVRSQRFGEALASFATAHSEASSKSGPTGDEDAAAYRARLAGMAGHAALALGDMQEGEKWLAQSVEDASRSAAAQRSGSPQRSGSKGQPANPLAAQLAVDLAQVQFERGRMDAAADTLAKARLYDPALAHAWLLSATLARREGRIAEAAQLIAKGAELAPSNPQTQLEAGVIAAMQVRDEAAAEHFTRAIQLAPDTPTAAQAQAYLEQLNAPAEAASEGPP